MQKSDKQRHIAKCLLGGAVCWSAVAVSAALLLGSAGALFAMRVFHHKTRHWYFKFGIPAILLAQIALGVFVYVRFFAA